MKIYTLSLHDALPIYQGTEPIGTDGEGHGAERPDRRHLHDDADDAEEHFGGGIDGAVDLLAELAQTRDGTARQDRHQQDLKQIAAGERAEEAVRDDPQQTSDEAPPRGLGDV